MTELNELRNQANSLISTAKMYVTEANLQQKREVTEIIGILGKMDTIIDDLRRFNQVHIIVDINRAKKALADAYAQ